MLVLTLKKTNSITIGSATIRIADTEREADKVRITIEAPAHILISRSDAICKGPKKGQS